MDWLNAFALVVMIAGNTSLWVAFVNRTHALPWRPAPLHRLRRIHDVMILVVPPLLIVQLGLTGPKLLLGGSWSQLSVGWWIVVGFCLFGFVILVANIMRHFLYRPPLSLVSHSSRLVNITETLGHPPIEPGKYRRLAELSINQQFDVEFNEKVFEFESLPPALDNLSILHISDWHFHGTISKDYFTAVSHIAAEREVDLICFTGDLIDNMACTAWIADTLGTLTSRHGNYFILGNHDWYQQPSSIRKELEQVGWVDVAQQNQSLEINDCVIELSGDETPWMGTAPAISSSADFRILLSHTPDNFFRAQSQGVDLMLSGHNHGGQVRLPVLGPVYSPSMFGTQYASGIFSKPPTLLHVSRGLSGKHPFRYLCHPEVSTITLRTKKPGQHS